MSRCVKERERGIGKIDSNEISIPANAKLCFHFKEEIRRRIGSSTFNFFLFLLVWKKNFNGECFRFAFKLFFIRWIFCKNRNWKLVEKDCLDAFWQNPRLRRQNLVFFEAASLLFGYNEGFSCKAEMNPFLVKTFSKFGLLLKSWFFSSTQDRRIKRPFPSAF